MFIGRESLGWLLVQFTAVTGPAGQGTDPEGLLGGHSWLSAGLGVPLNLNVKFCVYGGIRIVCALFIRKSGTQCP